MGGAALSSRQCQEGGTRVTYHCCRLRKEVSELICREINRSKFSSSGRNTDGKPSLLAEAEGWGKTSGAATEPSAVTEPSVLRRTRPASRSSIIAAVSWCKVDRGVFLFDLMLGTVVVISRPGSWYGGIRSQPQ
ncbi:hypothetical protein MRX96_038919 [Rhipicephalus microplus]